MLENNGRELIASIIDDIVAGRDYHALDSVKNVLRKSAAERVTELKKEHIKTMFKEDDV